jgi:hypothetical protein
MAYVLIFSSGLEVFLPIDSSARESMVPTLALSGLLAELLKAVALVRFYNSATLL